MSVKELKEQLHQAIGSIQDEAVLKSMLLVAMSPFRIDDDPLTPEEIEILERRHEAYLRGEEKAISWEEVDARIREKLGFKKIK